jgi:hypothetical protein
VSYCDILIPMNIRPPTNINTAITMRIIAHMGSSDLVTGAGAGASTGAGAWAGAVGGTIGIPGVNATGQTAQAVF